MFGQPWSRRQSSAASISSIRTSHSEDAKITKDCIISTTAEVTAFVSDSPPPTSPINDESHEAGTYSQAHCDPLGGNETQALWKCMLELQQRYGCYNSRRMDLAVTAGDEAMSLMRKQSAFCRCWTMHLLGSM